MGWTIINKSDAGSLDFSMLPFTSVDKLRHSLDGTKVVVKYIGAKPSFLDGTTDYTYAVSYTHLTLPTKRIL